MKNVLLSLYFCVAAAVAADLPVKQVILYKHGVGFFERAGTLGPGESARLDFNASDMNDVLKSLTLTDSSGAKISGLRYDSMDPLSHKLAEFPFQIQGGQSLAAMFDQLKGARVEVRLGSDTVAGIIVTGRVVEGTDKQPEREYLTLMLDSGDMRTVDLSAASSIRFPDAKLQGQFKDYLAALSAARSKDKRSVYIDSSDAKERQVVASYMIPAAVWKSSYRLIFGEKGQPTLEGWAIVDNTTGEDWTKVQLSLVSGRPISFVSQLYAPKYVYRPGAELADDAAARPVVHDEAFQTTTGSIGQGSGGGYGGAAGRSVVSGPVPKATPPPLAPSAPARMSLNGRDAAELIAITSDGANRLDAVSVAPSTIVASASSGELGELFEYRIAQPVTIRRDESAMLPFLQQPIESRKLLIYSDHSSQHPTNAAELTNSTGKTLDGGPITVYDGGVYGGEALMETLKAGDKRLISYAVDLGTRITEAFGNKVAVVREIHVNRGMMTVKSAGEETRTYTIRNVDQKAKTLILEHPLRQEYTLLNQKPTEKTANAYRFEIALPAGASQEFVVNEERIFDNVFQLTNVTPDFLGGYIQNRTLSDAGRRQLQRIADEKSQIADNDRAIDDNRSQIRDLSSDEDRIRQNINSLNNVSSQQQLVQSYAKQLDQHEQQLAALRDQQAELNKKRAALQSELNKSIDGLTF
jgi:chaperonin cofactor prefoldin